MKQLKLLFLLKSLLILTVGAVLFSNWYFIADVVLQDAMMGSGLVAYILSGVATFLLSNKLFHFNRKWILSIILTILSFFMGEIIEKNNLTYKDSSFYLRIQEEKHRKWEEKESKRKKEQEVRVSIENKIYNDYITDLILGLELQKKYKYVTATQMSFDYILIYPENFETIICPIKVKPVNKDAFIRYFVLSKNVQGSYDLFEWYYLDPKEFTNTAMGPSLMKQLNSLADWNFSSRQINDEEFWNNYVLFRENEYYKYLKELDF